MSTAPKRSPNYQDPYGVVHATYTQRVQGFWSVENDTVKRYTACLCKVVTGPSAPCWWPETDEDVNCVGCLAAGEP